MDMVTILRSLLPVTQITELCAGVSILIDLTLGYLNFDKIFEKIDYQLWEEASRPEIKRSYRQSFVNINVITHTESIPKTDIIILNHSIDDLFIGLWNERHQRDYWGEFTDWDKVDAAWELAMPEREEYLTILKDFVRKLTERLHPGGWLIIRDYPSAYETHRKHLARINFTRNLTLTLVQELLDRDMELHRPTLDASYPPSIQDTFFMLTPKADYLKIQERHLNP